MREEDPASAEVGTAAKPADPVVRVHERGRRWEVRRRAAQVPAVISIGGMLGAVARHGVTLAFPPSSGGWPWPTVMVNVTGCLLIGVLMVLIVEARATHRLVRPFLGVGVLGGYTTFSTYAGEAQSLMAAGRPAAALVYLTGAAAAALLAVQIGVSLTRAVALPHPEARARRAERRGGNR